MSVNMTFSNANFPFLILKVIVSEAKKQSEKYFPNSFSICVPQLVNHNDTSVYHEHNNPITR